MSQSGVQSWKVPGKWVLAGEHAVMRGFPALAMPHPELALTLTYEPASGGLKAPSSVMALIDRLATLTQLKTPGGKLRVESTIPSGSGLGSSAALSVALVRWWQAVHSTGGAKELFEWARSLEDVFHGRSSGMDIAAVIAGSPIVYQSGVASPIVWGSAGAASNPAALVLPRFSFHDTGVRSKTRDCVERVAELASRQPDMAQALDLKMAEAAEHAKAAWLAGGLIELATAVDQAQECFDSWGLTPPEAHALRKTLRSQGALASKLTGAGGGGFVVALWPENR